MKQLPRLYKQSKTGKTQIIDIMANNDTYTITWGVLDGAMQSKSTKATSKNIGKSNETSPSEQALLEAEALWAKKKKNGYSTDATAPTTVSLPMKVKVWTKDKLPPKVTFPLVSTPKINGVNGTYRLEDNTLNLYSRGGELYPPIPHLESEIKQVMEYLDSKELNGELYIPNTHLQDITSAVKKPKELSKSLEFHIFDIADSKAVYDVRRDSMILAECNLEDLKHIKFLTGMDCMDHSDIEFHYTSCMNSGLEGTVIKDPDNIYEHNVRSNRQWKYKKALDAEFQIAGVTEDKNGHPVFTFNSPGGQFKAKPKGTSEQRKAILEASKNYIGKFATVEYETLSKGSNGLPGIPLKPVMIALRDVNPVTHEPTT
jgi:ATP-dependent DNA ligase